MAADPEVDVVARLNTAVGALTTGTNLFRGRVQPPENGVPHEAVFVQLSGGVSPEPYSGDSPLDLRQPEVQVRVRSNPQDYIGGIALVDSVRDALHEQALSADYIDIRLNQEPFYLREDDRGHHEWSLNFTLRYEEAPG